MAKISFSDVVDGVAHVAHIAHDITGVLKGATMIRLKRPGGKPSGVDVDDLIDLAIQWADQIGTRDPKIAAARKHLNAALAVLKGEAAEVEGGKSGAGDKTTGGKGKSKGKEAPAAPEAPADGAPVRSVPGFPGAV